MLVGPRVPSAVLKDCAAKAGSPYHAVADEVYEDFDEENSAIARAALNMLRQLPGFERLDQVTQHPARNSDLKNKLLLYANASELIDRSLSSLVYLSIRLVLSLPIIIAARN